jgi:hypothetical protein
VVVAAWAVVAVNVAAADPEIVAIATMIGTSLRPLGFMRMILSRA